MKNIVLSDLQILSAAEATHVLGTQDIGHDPAGATLGAAVRGSEVRPFRHGEITSQQLHNALLAGYDLLMVVTDVPRDDHVVLTENILIIADESRARQAQALIRQGHPYVTERFLQLTAQVV